MSKPKPRTDKQLSLNIPTSLHARLKVYCAKRTRLIRDVVPEALTSYLDQQERRA